MENVSMSDGINYVCGLAEKLNLSDNAQVIDGLAEVEIKGITYQVQMVLEPKKSNWCQEGVPTIRVIED